MRGMLVILRGKFTAEFFIATGDDNGLKRLRHLVEFRENFRHRSHPKAAAQHEQHRQVISPAITFSHRFRVG